jgi:uncharacterized protein
MVIVVGWLFLLLGIAGLFLPILQGILFILIGLAILSTEYIWAHHLLHRLHERFPKLARPLEMARAKARKWTRHEARPAASDD